MSSRISRWRFMLERGLNIPDYVENPHSKHDNNTMLFLKEVFFGYSFVTFLAESMNGEECQDFDGKDLSNILLMTTQLENRGCTVWIAEGVSCEYKGIIWLWQDSSGKFKCKGSRNRNYLFRDFECIQDVIERIIVRRVFEFLRQTSFDGVKMEFGWSKTFLGKLDEKIIFFDFEELKKSA